MKNPIINSPYREPTRHFKADERGISDEILEFRRPSSFYIPVPRTRKKDTQLEMNLAEGAYSEEMQRENEFINKMRARVKELILRPNSSGDSELSWYAIYRQFENIVPIYGAP